MRQFGLIGYPLSHSFSERYFADKFKREGIRDASYRNFPIPAIEDLPGIIHDHPNLEGLNVTIPYKQQVLPYLDATDTDAGAMAAVNTIKIDRNSNNTGKHATQYALKGFNTDLYGFETSLQPLLGKKHTHALVLGTGGASKAVVYALKRLGISFLMVSRNPDKEGVVSYQDLDSSTMNAYHVIVNTTPLGMYPDTGRCPAIPYQHLTAGHVLYDLIYNPPETAFLKAGKKRGCTIKNGLEMLQLQAEKSWEIWNG